jgi:hypothetical protein
MTTPPPVTIRPVTIRPGTPDDSAGQMAVFLHAVQHLAYRIGVDREYAPPSAADLDAGQATYGLLMDHLAATADQWWVAEQDGRIVGYARSIVRDGVRSLTEFFVLPTAQATGVGRMLLARAFPAGGVRRRYIISTLDLAAQSLYVRAGVHHVCPLYTFLRQPAPRPKGTRPPADVSFAPITTEPDCLDTLDDLDRDVLGYARRVDHRWLAAHRTGFLARRGDRPVGYGYVAQLSGPFVAIDPAAMTGLLAYAEQTAYMLDLAEFGLDVPMHNHTAVDYLLGRGYRLSPFFCHLLCDDPGLDVRRQLLMAPMIAL